MSDVRHIACPKCGKSYAWKEHLGGRKVRCSACSQTFMFPAASPAGAPGAEEYIISSEPSPPPPLKTCPSCGRPVRQETTRCRDCGCDFTAPSWAEGARGCLPNTIRLLDILKVPFSGDLPAQAIVLSVGTTVWAFLVVLLAGLALVLPDAQMRLMFMGFTLLAMLASCGWLMRKYLGLAAQYESGALSSTTEWSKTEALGMVLLVSILMGGPIALGVYEPAYLPVSVAAVLLYVPMAVAMAGAYRIVNPMKVVAKIVETFPGYGMVMLYAIPFWLVVQLLSTLVESLLVIHFPLAGRLFGAMIAAVLSQYGIVAVYAMVGSLLRRYKQQARPTREEFKACRKSIVIAVAAGVALAGLRVSPMWTDLRYRSSPEGIAQKHQAEEARLAAQAKAEADRIEAENKAQEEARKQREVRRLADLEKDWATYQPPPCVDAGKVVAPGTVMVNSIGMKLVLVPPGQFIMNEASNSSVKPRVRISKGFYIGMTEVTQAQWKQVMGDNPSKFPGDSLPVHNVSWPQAVEFCSALSQKENRTYRLPTEAQWEYACRANSPDLPTPKYTAKDGRGLPFGWFSENCNEAFKGNSWEEPPRQPHPVSLKTPNAWGLFDMHGNVREWCRDMDGGYPKPEVFAVDPTGAAKPQFKTFCVRVLKGGAVSEQWGDCRALDRFRADVTDGDPVTDRDPMNGFRVVLELAH